jgi:hypothetical protein
LLDALKRIEPNTKLPPQLRGARVDWDRKAEVVRFIQARVGDFSRGNVTKAVEAAHRKFKYAEAANVWRIWGAYDDSTWLAQPVTAARVPISAPPRKRRPKPRSMLQTMSRPVAAPDCGCFQLVEFTSTLSRLVAGPAQHEKGDTSEVSP